PLVPPVDRAEPAHPRGGDPTRQPGPATTPWSSGDGRSRPRQLQDGGGVVRRRHRAAGGATQLDRLVHKFGIGGRAVATVEPQAEMEMAAAVEGEAGDLAGDDVASGDGDGPRQRAVAHELEIDGEGA